MKDLSQIIYVESLMDIENSIRSIEEFKRMNRKYIYTKNEGLFDDAINTEKILLDELLDYHRKRFGEDVNVRLIRDKIIGVGMRIKDALTIISYIENTGRKLKDNEIIFIEGIKEKSKPLTTKQANWLTGIYQRVTE